MKKNSLPGRKKMNELNIGDRSPKYEKVRGYYLRGLWNLKRLRDAVEKNWITVEEFTFITGEEY